MLDYFGYLGWFVLSCARAICILGIMRIGRVGGSGILIPSHTKKKKKKGQFVNENESKVKAVPMALSSFTLFLKVPRS